MGLVMPLKEINKARRVQIARNAVLIWVLLIER